MLSAVEGLMFGGERRQSHVEYGVWLAGWGGFGRVERGYGGGTWEERVRLSMLDMIGQDRLGR